MSKIREILINLAKKSAQQGYEGVFGAGRGRIPQFTDDAETQIRKLIPKDKKMPTRNEIIDAVLEGDTTGDNERGYSEHYKDTLKALFE